MLVKYQSNYLHFVIHTSWCYYFDLVGHFQFSFKVHITAHPHDALYAEYYNIGFPDWQSCVILHRCIWEGRVHQLDTYIYLSPLLKCIWVIFTEIFGSISLSFLLSWPLIKCHWLHIINAGGQLAPVLRILYAAMERMTTGIVASEWLYIARETLQTEFSSTLHKNYGKKDMQTA